MKTLAKDNRLPRPACKARCALDLFSAGAIDKETEEIELRPSTPETAQDSAPGSDGNPGQFAQADRRDTQQKRPKKTLVELVGIEPATSSLRTRRSPS
jgi:hypothetical protein